MAGYDFVLKETDGGDVSLKDYAGKNVVLFFYPKDNTSGCTVEANEFKELNSEFNGLNTVILGISRDSLKSHAKFREKNELPYILLSDEDKEVHNMFEVMKMKKVCGKESLGVERSTFVFNENGELVKEFRKVKSKGHAQEVLDYIKSL
ncbi:peroxiredoxin [Clostridium sp.]|uniref:peroxiredoxin n=1 Tax=Clostridium sp. TaxID=1506 RepID=UPI002FCCA08C